MPKVIASGTAIDVVAPDMAWRGQAILVFAGSVLVALCAQVSIPLPFTPVPLTGSTLGVLTVGALLGPRRGAAAALLYLLEGGIGLPFFAGGAAGWACLFGPTGGYLICFIPGALVAGSLARRGWDRSPIGAFALMLAASSAILACGLLVLVRWVGPAHLLAFGLYPFIAGDILKSAIAAGLLPAGWKWLEGRR
jgi:biotin transport system substrate-specific component